jgi:hypothetical protein
LFYKIDNIRDDYILGSEFLERYNPITIYFKTMMVTLHVASRIEYFPLSYTSTLRCPINPQANTTSNLVSLILHRLFKFERAIAYVETHMDKTLSNISEKSGLHVHIGWYTTYN